MPIGIDPKVDFAFKLVFGSPGHSAVTIHFLNSVLNPVQPITEVEILNPIQGKDRSEDKLVVLDVLAQDSGGHRFNIEMQTTLPLDLPQRLTYYGCMNLVRQISEGEPYFSIRPSISICVLSRTLFPESSPFHLSFRLRCDQEPLVFSDSLEFHTLELPKFRPTDDNIRACPPIEKWLYFLLQAEHMEADELSEQLGDPAFREALGVLEMISRSPEDRQFYEARQKFLHDEQARLIAARLEGREEGREEGRLEGRDNGILIGKIELLEDLLGDSPTPAAELTSQSDHALRTMVAQLQERLRKQNT